MKKQSKKKLNAVERLVSSLESRIKTYQKNKTRINSEYRARLAVENRKIADAQLQLRALKK